MPQTILRAASLLTALVASHHCAKADLLLTVDPATGQAQIRATSTIPIDGYAIYSASGSLTPATWNSLQDQAVTGWEQAPPAPTATAIAELRADGALVFANQSGFQLGQLFNTVGATQDLRLEFLLPNEDVPRQGSVTYGGITPKFPPLGELSGDYNDNHVVDGADYVVWRKFLNQSVTIPNDDTDGMVTQEDYNVWRANTGLTTLTPISTLPADVNNSGTTDIHDYVIIRNNFLGTNRALATGDVSGDTVVNFTDFRFWKMRRTAGAGAGLEPAGSGLGIPAGVPEPTSALMIVSAALLSAARRRRSPEDCTFKLC